MKKKRKWIKWVILLIVLALIGAGFAMMSKEKKAASYTEVPVTMGSIETYYNFDGLVKARRTQTITSEAADTVRTVYVGRNETVHKGDRLYKLDSGATIEADIDGEVTGLHVEEGGVLNAGDVTVEIIDMSSLEVQLDVDEYDVTALTPGAPIQVSVLALDETFDANVLSLDKNGMSSGDLSYYTATAALDGASGAYPGMQVSAKLLRDQAENVVLLRQDALQFDAYNMPYVYMREQNEEEPVRVPVKVGMTDGVMCEILEGVQAGDKVLRPNDMSMEELMMMMHEKGMSM